MGRRYRTLEVDCDIRDFDDDVIIEVAQEIIEKRGQPPLVESEGRLSHQHPLYPRLIRIRDELRPIAHTLPDSLNQLFYDLIGVDLK